MSTSDPDRPVLSPSAIGQFFRLQSCPMYLQWTYDPEAMDLVEKREWEPTQLSPVLSGEGDDFERRQLERLQGPNRRLIGLESESVSSADAKYDEMWAEEDDRARQQLRAAVRDVAVASTSAPELVVHQAPLVGDIGAYTVRGYADFLHLVPTSDGVRATVFEVKSSSSQKVHHRYQAVIYAMLVEDLLEREDVRVETDSGTVEAAVVTPENDIRDGPENVETFDTGPYRVKLALKLQEGGSFDQTILETSFRDTRNRIARRCSGCEYEPLCVSRGLEQQGLELLGLQAGTQESLEHLGITRIQDFATLFEQPGSEAKHYEYEALEPVDEKLVSRVRREADVSNLQKRAQIAYRFLAEIDDEYGRDGPDFYPYALQGTGNNVPEDDHGKTDVDWTKESGPDYPSGSLVRVYLYVHQDFAQDRVTLLSAYVESTMTERSRQIVELPNDLPTSDREKDAEENRLFGVFLEELAKAVDEVAPDLSTDLDVDLGLDPGEGFLHLYLYSDRHREALMDSIRRHQTADWRRPLRTLLGLRAGIDQEMVSVLQDDFRKRWAFRFPGLGLVQSVAHFQPWGGDWFDWRGERPDGSTAPLHEIFSTDIFDSTVRHDDLDGSLTLNHGDTELSWTPDDKRLARWVYPIRNRETDTIPTEYVWAVLDRLEPRETDDPDRARQYCYRTEDEEDPITEEDLALLAERFNRAVHHVERSLRAKDRYVTKEPIDLSALSGFAFDRRTLDEACIEYQQLEYHTIRTGLEAYYRQPLAERIDSGTSIAFECTAVKEERNLLEGRLLTSDLEVCDPSSPDGIIGGPLSVSDHDFMILTKLTDDGTRPEDVYGGDPRNIAHSPTAILSTVDESSGSVRVTLPFGDGWPRGNDEYTTWHKGWGTDDEALEDGFTVHVEAGDRFVLDPMIDQITQARAYEALEHAVDTPVRRWLRQLYRGERDRISINAWEESAVQEYVERMSEADGFERPNQEQRSLIEDVDHGIVTLQGPPGTGKTKYTVAPAILARVHAALEADEGMLGAVSAVSHSAVDEALESVVDLLEACPPGDWEDVALFRICSSSTQGSDHPRVRNVYYNGDDLDVIRELYERYLSPEASSDATALFFGPPVSIRSFINKMLRSVDAAEQDRVSELMNEGASDLFDLAIVDEASMMDLPLCLLFGSFLNENGQFVLVGDHRQMQPIQQHGWEDEDREPIEIHVPFLSALDFLRYLRGEDVDIKYFQSEAPVLEDPDETLPVHRLRETYRLPPESAQVHTDLFYEQDGIELESAGPNPYFDLGDRVEDLPEPLVDVLTSEDRVVLLVHDEGQSQKSNPVEQALVTELLGPLSERGADTSGGESDDLTAGVVVPFRAQRRDVMELVSDTVQVDTVERFQGGERDLMMLSMTASDRGYISGISEFLLEPNRFNVGASRMKRKLVVLASAGLFEESSNDVDQFERHEAWVSFYEAMGGLEGDYEEHTLDELLTSTVRDRFLEDRDARRTLVRVYSGYPY